MKSKLTFLQKLFIAIAFGILLGIFVKSFITNDTALSYFGKTIETVGYVVFQLIIFSIPLILLGFVASGISELGTSGGKVLGINALYAYISTVVAGLLAYFFGVAILPSLLEGSKIAIMGEENVYEPIFKLDIPPVMDTITALILAIVLGIVSSRLVAGKSVLKGLVSDTRVVADFIVQKLVIPLLPVYVFSIFFKMSVSNSFVDFLVTSLKVVILTVAVQWFVIFLHYAIHSVREKRILNIFFYIKNVFPAYLTAVGTRSSIATLPVTIVCAQKCKVSQNVIDFSIPINANIHMPGSMISVAMSSIAVIFANGGSIGLVEYLPFMLMLAVAMVSAPGVPGGAVVVAMGFLETMIGFNSEMIALMMALDVILDSFATAGNVTCDASIAKFIEKQFQKNVSG